MKLSDAKQGDYVALNKHAPQEIRQAYGIGPFKITKVLKRKIHLEGSLSFDVTSPQLSAFFEPCFLRLVA